MPYPPDTSSTVSSSDFVMQGNPDANQSQLNETFQVTTLGIQVLGSAGQTKGFAKYSYQPDPNLGPSITSLNTQMGDLKADHPEVQRFADAQEIASDTSRDVRRLERVLGDPNRNLSDSDRNEVQRELDGYKAKLLKAEQEMNQCRPLSPQVGLYEQCSAEVKQLTVIQQKEEELHSATRALYNRDGKNRPSLKTAQEGGDRSMLSRAVGSKLVDNFLGTDALAEERFGVDSRGRSIGISVQVQGAGIISQYEGKEAFLNTDYSDPRIQKGLSDLEVNDYITGQLDRHPGNIFVDPITKKVTGIDNDLAFPECTRQQAIINKTAYDKAVQSLPSPIHKDTAAQILKRDPEALRKQLKDMPAPNGVGTLSDASINGAVERLKEVQAGLKSGTIQTVDQFNKQTYDAALKKQDDILIKSSSVGKGLSQCQSEEDVGRATQQDRGSYLGSVALTRHKNQVFSAISPGKNVLRPETAVPRMSVDPRFQNYQKMDAAGKQQYEKTASEFLDLEQKHSACRQKQAALNVKPHGMKAVTAFFNPGKQDKARQALLKEEGDILKQMYAKLDDLEKQTAQHLQQQKQLQQRTPPPTELQLDKKEVASLLTSLDKLEKNPQQKPSDGLNLDPQEANGMATTLKKLSTSQQLASSRLSLDDQTIAELNTALAKFTPQQLQQATQIGGQSQGGGQVQDQGQKPVTVTTEELDKMIADLKSLKPGSDRKVAHGEHTVGGDLHIDHVGTGVEPSLKESQSVATKQPQQKAGSSHSLRSEHPELVHGPGQKGDSHHHSEHL